MLPSSPDSSASPLGGATEQHPGHRDPHQGPNCGQEPLGRVAWGEWLGSLPHPLSAGPRLPQLGRPRCSREGPPSHPPVPPVLTSASGPGCLRLAPLGSGAEPRSPNAGGVCPRRGSEGRRTAAAGTGRLPSFLPSFSPSCLSSLPPA